MKRTVLFIFLIVVLLSFAACGSKKDTSSDGNGQTTEITTNDNGEEGYYDSEGYFWLTDGSGYYDTNGTFVTTNAPRVSQEATEVTVFKDKLIGNYGTASSANVVVEAGQATIYYERDAYTLPGSAFSEVRSEGNQNDYNFYVNDTGASGTLRFYEDADIPLQVEVTYTDNSGADLYFSVEKSYVLNRLPLEGYVSLDSQGEFGAIPMSEDVKKLLFEGMTDDYIFTYNSESSASVTDSDGFVTSGGDCTFYEITSFDENGFDNSDTYSNYVYEFKNKSDADAFYKSELNETAGKVVTQSGNAVGECSTDERSTEMYKKPGGKWSKLHCMYVYEKGIVYGEHCMYDDYDDKYIYFSKPYTIEEGKVFNETSILMGSMYCSQLPSTDNKYTLSIKGDIHDNNINIRDNEGDTIMDGIFNVKAVDNTIIAYQYEIYGTATYVAELTLDGDTISVKYYKYDGTGELTYDNYKDAKAVSEGEFQATITDAY